MDPGYAQWSFSKGVLWTACGVVTLNRRNAIPKLLISRTNVSAAAGVSPYAHMVLYRLPVMVIVLITLYVGKNATIWKLHPTSVQKSAMQRREKTSVLK